MLTCHNVADYLLAQQDAESGDTISNLKLQKLVYYAQGYHLAIYDEPLFSEQIEAWTHGPVVPDLYHRFKSYGSSSLPVVTELDLSIFNNSVQELLDEVYSVFNQFSAWTLRNMTHEEKPWKDHESDVSVIPTETLKDFFKSRIK
jgi:uncharacterized phage-associated protein